MAGVAGTPSSSDGRFDLAAVDILRDRERGVPRYNEFLRLIRKEPVKSFEELAGDPALGEQLRQVYGGDLEKVDLMVGLYAEPELAAPLDGIANPFAPWKAATAQVRATTAG